MFPLLAGARRCGDRSHHQQLRQYHRGDCLPEASCEVGDVGGCGVGSWCVCVCVCVCVWDGEGKDVE